MRGSSSWMIVLGVVAAAAHADDPLYVWWEAERPRSTSFPGHTWISPEPEERGLLSGGDWLTHAGKQGDRIAYATYGIVVPEDGTYELWVRKFWKYGPFRWRFDDDDWAVCTEDAGLSDRTDLREHVTLNWVFLGDVTLEAGRREFRLELVAGVGDEQLSGFDCFVLNRGAFLPQGRLKPDHEPEASDPDWFAVTRRPDPFGDDAMLDLSALNEDVAGESGFVTSRDGRFFLGNGEPTRFWAVNVGPRNVVQDHRTIDYMARRLAKLGVNMVRFHGEIHDRARSDETMDERTLDGLFYLISALEREGIYTSISIYYLIWVSPNENNGLTGFETLEGPPKPFGLMFFHPRLHELYRGWLRRLLNTENPYTGRTLAEDPAVAIVELMNEDSLLFWTLTRRNIPEHHWRQLETLFTEWAAECHGSIDAAFEYWGRAKVEGDDRRGGRAALMEVWHLTGDGLDKGGRAKRRRAADQARFLVELERRFYTSFRDFLKGELGYGGLVVAGNWEVADPRVLDALEAYAYMAGDVIDRHSYFENEHRGPTSGYQLQPGQTYADRSALRHPEVMPVQANQVRGYPQIISEFGWPNPNRFRAEGTFLTAAYASLQGIDGVYFFAVGSNYLLDSALLKFPVSSPVVAGTFPATALIYRRGDVREPDPFVVQSLDLEALFALEGSDGAAAQGIDDHRRDEVPQEPGAVDTGGMPPLAFFVGPVMRSLDGAAGGGGWTPVRFRDHLDPEGRTIRAVTGELEWDYGRGLVTLDAPRAQGAVGFLSGEETIQLTDVTLRCGNEFASVLVVSLDGRPLADSRRLLVQAMTEEKTEGYETIIDDEGRRRITDLGGPPLIVRRIDASITVPAPAGRSSIHVTPLDLNGYPTDATVEIRDVDGGVEVRLARDALYHVITRAP